PVGREYRNQNAAFADFDPPQPMNHGDIANRKFLPRFDGQILKPAERHAFVGLVLEVERPAVAAVVTHDAVEDHDSAILRTLKCRHNIMRNNSLANQLHQWLIGSRAPAHRWKQGNLISRVKLSILTG